MVQESHGLDAIPDHAQVVAYLGNLEGFGDQAYIAHIVVYHQDLIGTIDL
jgi:hypothetical protein